MTACAPNYEKPRLSPPFKCLLPAGLDWWHKINVQAMISFLAHCTILCWLHWPKDLYPQFTRFLSCVLLHPRNTCSASSSNPKTTSLGSLSFFFFFNFGSGHNHRHEKAQRDLSPSIQHHPFSTGYPVHHPVWSRAFSFCLLKVWKLQNNLAGKRRDVTEDISLPKSSENLDKPQALFLFLSYLHIHFNFPILTTFVAV